MRNRILAALSEVLVVVESRERGGSLITAQAAIERDVEVMAVPGSVRNRAAAGTNQLLRDGAAPVTDVDDVLVALGLDTRRPGRSAYDPRPLPRGVEAAVLAACRRDPRTLDDIVAGLGLPIGEAAMALARLERTGWVRETGGWFEPVVSWSGPSVNEYPRPGAPTSSEPSPTVVATSRRPGVDSFARSLTLAVRAHRRRLRLRRAWLRPLGGARRASTARQR